MSSKPEILVRDDADGAADEAASLFVQRADESIRERGCFTALLSGGSTPKKMFDRLVSKKVDWSRVHLFWGDERAVPPESLESNFRMAREALLSRVPIPESGIHRIQGELSPIDAASRYAEEMRRFFGVRGDGYPRFDLALQGVGTDGHTASLFPGSTTVLDPLDWVIAPYVEKLGAFRISVTLGVLNHARSVMFLVTGSEKAEIIRQLTGPTPEHQALFPAQRVRPIDGELVWVLDRAAAGRLNSFAA